MVLSLNLNIWRVLDVKRINEVPTKLSLYHRLYILIWNHKFVLIYVPGGFSFLVQCRYNTLIVEFARHWRQRNKQAMRKLRVFWAYPELLSFLILHCEMIRLGSRIQTTGTKGTLKSPSFPNSDRGSLLQDVFLKQNQLKQPYLNLDSDKPSKSFLNLILRIPHSSNTRWYQEWDIADSCINIITVFIWYILILGPSLL